MKRARSSLPRSWDGTEVRELEVLALWWRASKEGAGERKSDREKGECEVEAGSRILQLCDCRQ